MPSGIIEKSNKGFFANEIEYNGKYATIARRLKEDLGVFPTLREVYVTAAILGFLHGRKETPDTTEKVGEASIFPTELNARKADLRLIYRIMMLVEDEPSFTIDDYMNRAFRDDSDTENPENLKRNMAVFNSYACGGLEFMDEKLGNLENTDAVIDALYELVHGFAVDIGMLDGEELPDFEPTFD